MINTEYQVTTRPFTRSSHHRARRGLGRHEAGPHRDSASWRADCGALQASVRERASTPNQFWQAVVVKAGGAKRLRDEERKSGGVACDRKLERSASALLPPMLSVSERAGSTHMRQADR